MFLNYERFLFKWDYGDYIVSYNIIDFLNLKIFENYF